LIEDTFTVSGGEAGSTLAEFLYRRLKYFSPAACRKMIGKKMVVVDGRWVSADYELSAGSLVELSVDDSHFMRVYPVDGALEVSYEDAACLVVCKEAGAVVIPERGEAGSDLLNALMHHVRTASAYASASDFPLPVHRIDRDTSGLVLVARNVQALEELSGQFERRLVDKAYLGVTIGEIAEDTFDVDLPLDTGRGRAVRVSHRRGRPSRTLVRVLKRFRGFSLVEAKPITGRRHQVRVHLAAVGHPLAADPLYGRSTGVFLSRIKSDYRAKGGRPEKPVMARLALHAGHLHFTSPVTGEDVEVSSEPPADFQRLLRVLAKYAR